MQTSKQSIADFWHHVYEADNGCWEFSGALLTTERGYAYRLYGSMTAHRVAALIYLGKKVGIVKRSCKNPHCVRRDHFASVGFERPVAEYDPFTGKRIENSNLLTHPAYQELLKLKHAGIGYSIEKLAKFHNVTVHELRRASRYATADLILLDRQRYIDNGLPVPMKPTGTRFDETDPAKPEVQTA